jgi:glutamate dehydrogenase (NADP+)
MFRTEYVKKVYADLQKNNANEPEFLQAAQEILESLELIVEKRPDIEQNRILERFLEPERFIQFRVAWLNDKNEVQVNRGYRVQYNSAIGPY